MNTFGARRPAPREIILGAAAHVVEGKSVINGNVVKLDGRQICLEAPALEPVVRLGHAAVASHHHMIGIVGIDPYHVIVNMVIGLVHLVQRLPAIIRLAQECVHHINPVHVLWVGEDLRVVHSDRVQLISSFPGRAPVLRAKDSTLSIRRFNGRVHRIRINRRHRHSNPSHVLGRQSGFQFVPGRACVGRLVNRALRSAINHREHVPPSLVRRRIKNVGIRRIEIDIRHARVLADRQNGFPGFSAVGRLIEPAVSPRPPKRTFSRDIHHLAVARINHDLANVFRFLQPQIFPALAAVVRPVNSVAVRNAALAVAFSRPHPHHGRIVRIERDPPDRIRSFVVENRSPGGAVVHRLPYSTRCHADIVLSVMVRIHSQRHHSPRSRRRPDQTKLQARKSVIVEVAFLGLSRSRLRRLLVLAQLLRRLFFPAFGGCSLCSNNRGKA